MVNLGFGNCTHSMLKSAQGREGEREIERERDMEGGERGKK